MMLFLPLMQNEPACVNELNTVRYTTVLQPGFGMISLDESITYLSPT